MFKCREKIVFVLMVTGGATGARAAVEPQLGGPMKHVMVTLTGTTVGVMVQGDPNEPLLLQDYGEAYDPPADVLNGVSYNGQYGWMAGGFINLPANLGIWIELLNQSAGLETHEAVTFDGILTTAGSGANWEWSGAMTHNWYAATDVGTYDAAYRVYVGDAAGNADAGYTPADVTLHWQLVPEPMTAAVLAVGGLAMRRRVLRRR